MKQIEELITLLNRNKVKSNVQLEALLEPGSKTKELFDLISEGRVKSEEEAIVMLYGGLSAKHSFNNLKIKLKDRLIESLPLLDFKTPNYSNRQRAYHDCNLKWAAIQILMTSNARMTGVELLEKLLQQALKYEFTEISLNALRLLRLHYGNVEGDLKKFEQINLRYDHLQTLWIWENRAEELYTSLTIGFVNSKSGKTEISQLARQYFDEISPWLSQYDSFKLHLFGRLMQISIYSSINDYQRTAELCEEALAFFKLKPYDSSLPSQVFYYQLAVSYIQLREFDKGQSLVRNVESVFEEGSFNWFKFKELFFLLAMHTERYADGATVCHQLINHPKLSNHPAHISEMWKIYQAYIYVLVRMGIISEDGYEHKSAKFKLQKFLNDVPVFSRDRQGMNIPVLIAQILLLIVERNYDASIDRIGAIEKYCSRYLKQTDTLRSNLFIKMLLQIPLASFHKEALMRKTAKHLKMLQDTPMEISNQAHEIEIIPYEMLWNMLITSLDRKGHRARGREA
jgi:hypothetical protein